MIVVDKTNKIGVYPINHHGFLLIFQSLVIGRDSEYWREGTGS